MAAPSERPPGASSLSIRLRLLSSVFSEVHLVAPWPPGLRVPTPRGPGLSYLFPS